MTPPLRTGLPGETMLPAHNARRAFPTLPHALIHPSAWKKEEFSEVGGSKQPIRRSGKSSITTWWHPFSVKTLRFGSSSCTVLYQGVATRNGSTTGEIRADLRRSDRGSWRQSQTASPPPQVLVR